MNSKYDTAIPCKIVPNFLNQIGLQTADVLMLKAVKA